MSELPGTLALAFSVTKLASGIFAEYTGHELLESLLIACALVAAIFIIPVACVTVPATRIMCGLTTL